VSDRSLPNYLDAKKLPNICIVLGRSPLQISPILFLHFLFSSRHKLISIPSLYVDLFVTRLRKANKISNSEIVGTRAAYQTIEPGDSPDLFFSFVSKVYLPSCLIKHHCMMMFEGCMTNEENMNIRNMVNIK